VHLVVIDDCLRSLRLRPELAPVPNRVPELGLHERLLTQSRITLDDAYIVRVWHVGLDAEGNGLLNALYNRVGIAQERGAAAVAVRAEVRRSRLHAGGGREPSRLPRPGDG